MQGFRGASRDWTLLGHALPDGSFSQTDATASRYAKTLCPKAPDLTSALAKDPDCFGGVVHCGRLFGIASNKIESALTRACEGDPEQGSMCNVSMSEWQTMAKASLPLTLK